MTADSARDVVRIHFRADADFETVVRRLCDRAAALPSSIEAAARDIIGAVRAGGDRALRELAQRFDGIGSGPLELDRAAWDDIAGRTDPAVLRALEHAAGRIRAFHERERERHTSFEIAERDGGVRLGLRVDPLARVGIYVPGGTARYPSTV